MALYDEKGGIVLGGWYEDMSLEPVIPSRRVVPFSPCNVRAFEGSGGLRCALVAPFGIPSLESFDSGGLGNSVFPNIVSKVEKSNWKSTGGI